MDDLSGPAGPLYQQVYDAVMARIISGELAPGVMLPSEFDLAAQYAVSQGTARKALSKLELSGLVERHQGKGTFVATTTDETSLFHFFRLRQSDGAQVIPQLVSETVRKRPANAREAAALGLENAIAKNLGLIPLMYANALLPVLAGGLAMVLPRWRWRRSSEPVMA